MDSAEAIVDALRTKIRSRSVRLRIFRAIEFICAGTVFWYLGSLLVHH